MNEPPVEQDTSEQDADAALARDPFALELGAEWHAEEPGVYRWRGGENAFELHASQKPAVADG